MTTGVEAEEIQKRVERLEHLIALLQGAVGGFTLQSGNTLLTNGVSPVISATILSTSKIYIAVGTAVADALTEDYAAIIADRVVTVLPGSGSFVVRAFTVAGREAVNTNAADQSTVIHWLVVNPVA